MNSYLGKIALSAATATTPSVVHDILGNYGSGTIEYSPEKNQRKDIKDIEEKINLNKKLLDNDISKFSKDKKDKLNRINHKIKESISEIEEILTQIKQNQLIIRDALKETLDESVNDLDTLNKMYNTICKG